MTVWLWDLEKDGKDDTPLDDVVSYIKQATWKGRKMRRQKVSN
jgi:hypothetical protein